MLSSVTSLTNNGLRDWLIQRVTALVLFVYFVAALFYFYFHPQLNYDAWVSFWTHPVVRVASILATFSFLLHAWIGLWTVTTDYLPRLWLRLTIQILLMLGLLSVFIWSLMILWGR